MDRYDTIWGKNDEKGMFKKPDGKWGLYSEAMQEIAEFKTDNGILCKILMERIEALSAKLSRLTNLINDDERAREFIDRYYRIGGSPLAGILNDYRAMLKEAL